MILELREIEFVGEIFIVENTDFSNTNPKVSVIIPVYNTEEFLSECLDSIINQTLKDIEIICINDGSTDNSLEILRQYAKNDSRIKVINQKNKGGGAARNRGLEIAVGEFLAFIDSDDFFNIDAIEKMYLKATNTKADIIVCGVKRFDNKVKEFKDCYWGLRVNQLPDKDVFSYKDMPKYIFNTFQNWNCNKMFRHKFIKENKIKFQEIFRTNDLLFTCSALVMADRITTIKEPLFNYRYNIVSCQSTNHLYPIDFFKAFKELRKFLIKKRKYKDVEESYINWALRACVYNINSIKKDISKKDSIYKVLSSHIRDIGITEQTTNLIWDKSEYEKLRKLINGYQKRMADYQRRKQKMFLQNIFSIKNYTGNNSKKHKVITLFGIKLKIRRK